GGDGLAFEAGDGGAHEDRLIGQRGYCQLRRKSGENLLQGALYAVDDIERGGFAGAGDSHEHTAVAVGAHDVVLDGEAVADLRDIFYIYGRAVNGLDRQVVQLGELERAAVDLNVIFGFGELGGAGGKDQVLQSQRIGDVDGREIFGVEL